MSVAKVESPIPPAPPDRFAVINARLCEIRDICHRLAKERSGLIDELAVLRASAEGFRVGVEITWTDRTDGEHKGTIVGVSPSSYGHWSLEVRQLPDQRLVNVGRGKKPYVHWSSRLPETDRTS